MTTIRSFKCDDLFSFNNVNLDLLTETVRSPHLSCASQQTVVIVGILILFSSEELCGVGLRSPLPSCSTTSPFTCSTSQSGQNTFSLRRGPGRDVRAIVRAELFLHAETSRRLSAPAAPRLDGADVCFVRFDGGLRDLSLLAVMGKAEGEGENWHGHVTAVTVRGASTKVADVREQKPPLRSSRIRHPSQPSRRPLLQVAPEYRRQGLANKLMILLEEITIKRRAPRPLSGRRAQAYRNTESSCDVNFLLDFLLQLLRHNGYFVDLFVRISNSVAIGMYRKARAAGKSSSGRAPRKPRAPSVSMRRRGRLVRIRDRPFTSLAPRFPPQFGYSVYRQVIGYYSGEEDAYGAQCR